MTTDQALLRLSSSTSEAVQNVLRTFTPDVTAGTVDLVPQGGHPLAGVSTPAVLADVSYVDGVTGGNVLVMPIEGARRLAAVMMGGDPDAVEAGGELDELSMSAVGEAMNQMMAGAAMATSDVLGQEVEIAPPETRLFSSSSEAAEAYEMAPHGTRATFRVCDEPCRLVQLVPNAFVVRMTRALDEMGVEHVSGNGAAPEGGDGPAVDEQVALDVALRDIRVQVWAELGRARVPLGAAPEMPDGSVLELDRKADDPVDLYVNGLRFASGTLVLTDDGEWALRLAEVAGREASETQTKTPEQEGAVS